jgi:hypothetical protein
MDIWLNQPQTYFYRDVTVADDGSFSLEVPAGSYYLGVATGVAENDCPGCAYERTPQREHDYTVENFQLDGDRQETIHLPRPSVLPVTVVDPAGRPVAGAWVRDLTSGQQPTIQDLLFPGTVTDVFTFVDQLTGTDGTVQLEFIAGAAPATISVDPPPGTTLPSLTAFPPHATSVTIRLQDGPTLQGRLLGANDGAFGVSEAYLVDDSGTQYPFAVSNGRYAVTAPAGRYRITMQEAHNEEGESSDYQVWSLQSSPFQLEGDRTLDLTVPLGYARLWVVNDDGQPTNDLGDGPQTTSSPFTIADGIDATAMTDLYGTGYASSNFPVIGPSTTSDLELDGASFPAGVRVAPGEDTIIAFILGTGPGYDHTPTTTTTTTTAQPTVTTTTGESGTATSSDPPVGTGSQLPGPTTRTGYWALGSDGHIYNFGDAPALGNAAIGAIDLEPTPTGKGYWTLNRNGTVQAFGDAAKLGEADTTKLAEGEEPASLSATPTGKGYWIFTNRGRVLAFGDAQFLGDMSQTKLNGPVLGSVATPSGKGYYMVASDGGIFAFGDATFAGSMGGKKLNAPVQSLVPDADGSGYWLVASDGGVFAFSAPFRGAMGGTRLNKPVSGMVRYGDGYLMVGADGGIFNFSTSPFSGSLGDKPPTAPVVAVAALPSI